MQKIDTTIIVNQKKKSTDKQKLKAAQVCSDCGGTRFRTLSTLNKVVICRACGAHKNL